MWPKKKTAILIIHGAGPHKLFETCEKFICGFYELLQDRNDETISIRHKLQKREGEGGWVQNYISLSLPGESRPTLDFYEYFWDIYMTHESSLGDAVKFLSRISEGGRLFYKSDSDLVKEALEEEAPYFRKTLLFGRGKVEFGPGAYLKLLGGFGKLLSWLWLIPGLSKIILTLTGIQPLPILNRVTRVIFGRVEKYVRDLTGDVVRYLDQDPRSVHFQTRQKVINGAVSELKELINNNEYEQIIVASHSLGTVIAYDALNRIIRDVNAEEDETSRKNAEKIKGLVTFGSPLDKVALFFKEDVPKLDDLRIRRRVLAHYHKFKALPLEEDDDGIEIEDPMKFALAEAVWLNFYHPRDLVSGRLDLYDLKDGNISIKGKFRRTREAHASYWTNKGMYDQIARTFFDGSVVPAHPETL